MTTRTGARPRLRPGPTTYVVLALLAYLPPLLTRPGILAADTKAYLFIDPGRLLERAAFMWDPNVAMGSVTHQNIGYLFPLGPLFWVVEQVPIPMWVGQRLWIGTTLFAAGAGFAWLARRLSLTGWAVLAGALVYQLSPYTLAYLGRTTVILLPWAALPWLVGLARRSLVEGGWRAPAWFALVVTLVGGTNASSLLFVGLAPVLWFPFAVWGTREARWQDALAAMARIGVLLVPTQLWWIAGLSLQGAYGLPILELTETVETVAETSTAAEVVRHLGYWYFYGRDGLEPWTASARFYTQNLGVILLSFALPALALLSGFVVRWRHRAYAVTLILVGAVIGIGTHPYDSPPPLAGAIKAAADASAAGMALRNSPRAVPLLVLGSALLITALLAALPAALVRWRSGRHVRLAPLAPALVAVVAVLNLPPLWTGGIVQHNLEYPETLPSYWTEALATVDARDDGSRVLEVPGMDFGTYRWGNTQDVITPGLIDRPWVGRQLIPFGSPASADLIRAWDRRLQDGTYELGALVPFARLVGAGDVLVRSDTQYERYRSPRPRVLWQGFADGVDGLADPLTFGEPRPNRAVPEQPMIDELALAADPGDPVPPPVALFPLESHPRPEVRTATRIENIVSGDGDGVIDLAAAGLLDQEPFVYAATFADEPARLARLVDDGARVTLTDTNRRRAQRWGTLRENDGYTEQAGEAPLERDPSDARLDVFPDADDDWYTTATIDGVRTVRASAYGNPVSYTPEDRAVLALDGHPGTAWRVGAFDEVRGERLEVVLDAPIDLDHVVVVLPLDGPNRWITELAVHLDGQRVAEVTLDDRSRTPDGQRIELPPTTATTIELEVLDANITGLSSYAGFSPVGIAELRIPGVEVEEIVDVPVAVLGALGADATDVPLDVVLTRRRANPAEPFRRDPEAALRRGVDLPGVRTFSLDGAARLSADVPGEVVDELVGVGRDATGLVVRTSDHLSGALRLRGSAAVDGDESTLWSPGYTGQAGRWIEVESAAPMTFDHLDLRVVADGRHSVPTRLLVEVDGVGHEVEVPPVSDGDAENHVVAARVDLPTTVTGSVVRVTVLEVRETTTIDYFSSAPLVMPIGVAELGLPVTRTDVVPSTIDSGCRDDLLRVDGRDVPLRIRGAVESALDRGALDVELCDGDGVELGPGSEIEATPGSDTGIDLDRLVLRSPSATAAPTEPAPPVVEVVGDERLARDLRVTDVDGPFWLVFGQSHSPGWTATVEGLGELGEPVLVDGHANGWYVEPPVGVDELHVGLRWEPQQRVWWGIGVSVLGVAVCLAVLLRRRRAGGALTAPDDGMPVLDDPTRADGASPGLVPTAVTAALLATVAGLIGGFAAAVVVGGLALAGLLHRRGRIGLVVAGTLAVPAVAAFVTLQQFRHEAPVGVEWPTTFDPAQWFVLVALLALAADVVVGAVRRRASRRGR